MRCSMSDRCGINSICPPDIRQRFARSETLERFLARIRCQLGRTDESHATSFRSLTAFAGTGVDSTHDLLLGFFER
jgi:hypothetical protein